MELSDSLPQRTEKSRRPLVRIIDTQVVILMRHVSSTKLGRYRLVHDVKSLYVGLVRDFSAGSYERSDIPTKIVKVSVFHKVN